MITYYDNHRTYDALRLHPYDPGGAQQSGYVDFKVEPEKIPTVLEDFLPYSHYPAVQTFYMLLKYINGPSSFLESCDCALRPPASHSDSNSSLPLSVHGRLFLMYREEGLNCSKEHAEWLCGKLMSILKEIDPELTANEAVIGFTLNPVLHTAISNGEWRADGSFECEESDPAHGLHTMLSFWGYGNDEVHAFANLARLFKNIEQGCIELNREIKRGIEEASAET